jgi:hypothetical protein
MAPHESQPSEVQRPSLDLIDFFDFCLPRQVSKVIDSLARCLGAQLGLNPFPTINQHRPSSLSKPWHNREALRLQPFSLLDLASILGQVYAFFGGSA